MSNSPAAMIFAAGLGTRMLPLTKELPKPLIKVAGKPLIDHGLALLEGLGIQKRVINLHYRGDMLQAYLKDRDIVFSDESDKLLDTGGGLKKALPLLESDTIIAMNTDAVWLGPNPLPMMIEAWDPARMDALLHVVPRKNAFGHKGPGDFLMNKDCQLTRGPGAIYTGLQIVKADLVRDIPQECFSMNVAWDAAGSNDRLFGFSNEVKWCDVGQPESISLAENLLKSANV